MTRNQIVLVSALCCAASWLGCSQQQPAPPPAAEATTATAEAPAPAQEAPAPAAQPAKPELAAAEAAATPAAELGKLAPDFTLTDAEGKTHTLSALKGKTVVLEWFNPDCPFVKYAHGEGELKTMATKVMSDTIVWLSVNSSALGKQGHGAERNVAAKSEYAMKNPILLDETGAVGKTYGAEKTPTLFVVDTQGTLIYRGGIDNAPIGKVDPARPRLPESKEGALVNYVDAALEDMKKKRALRLPDTPPYGCSVKYQS
jgi:peroxiredoxin